MPIEKTRPKLAEHKYECFVKIQMLNKEWDIRRLTITASSAVYAKRNCQKRLELMSKSTSWRQWRIYLVRKQQHSNS